MAFLIILTTLSVVIISYYLVAWTYWKRRGIPGPIGFPILGNVWDMTSPENPPYLKLREWTKKYGRYFGITEGPSRTLVISDSELVNEMFIKQFDNFYGRKLNGIMGDPNEDKRVHLFASEGYRWKRLRNLSSPTFSNNSLKKVKETVEDSALELLKHIEKNTANGQEIDMLEYYQEFTLDVICRIALGQPGSQVFNNPLIKPVRGIFGNGRRLLFFLGSILPKSVGYLLRRFVFLFPSFGGAGLRIQQGVQLELNKRIMQREEDAKNGIERGEPADFIDLFLDARADIDVKAESNNEFTKTSGKVSKSLTVDEIIGQCFVFLIAGFDTTALSLSYTTYLLATHPEIMRKVQEEIEEQCPDPSMAFEQLSKLKYLDHVIKETLRLYPLGTLANTRRCMKTTKIGDLLIEKDTNIQIDAWTLHYDKKLWGEDAEVFRPERWDEPGVTDFKSGYMPFGLGPRQCIGMRLAYMEEKLLLSQILRNYDFVTGEKTQIPLKLVGNSTTQPENVFVHLKSRY